MHFAYGNGRSKALKNTRKTEHYWKVSKNIDCDPAFHINHRILMGISQ